MILARDYEVVLLAAGCSRRLEHLTRDVPKAFLPVGERRIIDYALDSVEALGFERDSNNPDLGVRVILEANGSREDISEAIRMPEIAQGASTVSAHGDVRAALLELQRVAGRAGGVVLEGRDIGTVVFPDAEVKFFLTASAETRARRRHAELAAKSQTVTFEETLADVKRRDAQDEGRAVAPLKRAEEAILVDSTDLTFEDTVTKMLADVKRIAPGAS